MGSFGGQDWVPAPRDSIVVAVGALASYAWGVQAGTTPLSSHADLPHGLQARHSDEDPGATVCAWRLASQSAWNG